MNYDTQFLRDFLGDVALIENDPEHPLYNMIVGKKSGVKIDYDFETIQMSFKYILNSKEKVLVNWLETTKKRLLRGDLKDKKAAVAEIIACYSLSVAGFEVVPQKISSISTPDFLCKDTDGNEFIVEVYSRNFSDDAIQSIQKGRIALDDKIKKNDNKSGIYMEVTEVRPWGNSKDPCTEDAISKVCAIKQQERQLKDNIPSLIWVDIGITGNFFLGGTGFIPPLNSFNTYITSGHYWYGLYGKEGLPIFTHHYVELGYKIPPEMTKMQHDGRFVKSKQLSGMIFRFEGAEVLFENPASNNPIQNATRIRMLKLPHFKLEHSLANFYPNMVEEQNAVFEKYILSFSEKTR